MSDQFLCHRDVHRDLVYRTRKEERERVLAEVVKVLGVYVTLPDNAVKAIWHINTRFTKDERP